MDVSKRKNANLGQNGSCGGGSRDPLLEFWDPSISETIQAGNFKFGIELDVNLY